MVIQRVNHTMWTNVYVDAAVGYHRNPLLPWLFSCSVCSYCCQWCLLFYMAEKQIPNTRAVVMVTVAMAAINVVLPFTESLIVFIFFLFLFCLFFLKFFCQVCHSCPPSNLPAVWLPPLCIGICEEISMCDATRLFCMSIQCANTCCDTRVRFFFPFPVSYFVVCLFFFNVYWHCEIWCGMIHANATITMWPVSNTVLSVCLN